jgi:hypothetical protein
MGSPTNTTEYSATYTGPKTDGIKKSVRVLPNGLATANFQEGNAFVHFNTTTTGTQVKSGQGTLVALFIGTAGSGSSISIYDNIAGTTNPIATVNGQVTQPTYLPFGAAVANGIWIVIAGGTPDVTVTFL